MRRQDIQLIALARQGDAIARREVGRRYLLGTDGFPRHVQTGIDYLTRDGAAVSVQAAQILSECLPLEEIARLGLDDALRTSAAAGSSTAHVKLGVWLRARHGREADSLRHLELAAAAGHLAAKRAVTALRSNTTPQASLLVILRALSKGAEMDVLQVANLAATHALEESHLDRLLCALFAALTLAEDGATALDELVSCAVQLAEGKQRTVRPLSPLQVEASLDRRASQGDSWAAFALGRALTGLACGAMPPTDLAAKTNVRRGSALLLRAADAGWTAAWLHLFGLHSDHRLSVANPQMARFCLEKAALQGLAEAQRKLGALVLRSASTLTESEQAIGWLYRAATQGDRHARELLDSLRLTVPGSESDAREAIDRVRRDHPWLALRMRLARDFGLTKLEALCVDPAKGMRPWGLLVGKNPFIHQAGLSAPRAIPAPTETALDNLRRTALLFAESGRDASLIEGDARRRSLAQRRAFERHGVDEAMFFAKVSATTLNALRQGAKWAFRARTQLQTALAA